MDYCINLEEFMNETVDVESRLYEDLLFRYGCSLCIIQIGENVKNLADEIKEQEPQIDWRGWAGIRDRFTHQYHNLEIDELANAMENDVQLIKKACIKYIK